MLIFKILLTIYVIICSLAIYCFWELKKRNKKNKLKIKLGNFFLWSFIPPYNILLSLRGFVIALLEIQYYLSTLRFKLYNLKIKMCKKVLKGKK